MKENTVILSKLFEEFKDERSWYNRTLLSNIEITEERDSRGQFFKVNFNYVGGKGGFETAETLEKAREIVKKTMKETEDAIAYANSLKVLKYADDTDVCEQ